MAKLEINSFDISLNEAVQHVNEQLHQLLGNTRIHFSKRKKLLLQLERKNNHFRRSIHRSDFVNQKKLTENSEMIRHIKMKIINEARQQEQQRRHELEQNRHWSLDSSTTAIGGVVVAGVISLATFIIMMLVNSKEKYI